nr:extracellular solute-binding protein [Clostridia bacterium]
MKKLALLLLCSMLIPTFAACSDSADANPDTPVDTTAADTTAAVETTTADPNKDDLPAGLDFDGYEFKVNSRNAPLYFEAPMDVAEENGEAVNDAVFQRNRKVEERLNIVFTEIMYENADRDKIRNVLLAGDNTYDLYMGRINNAFDYALEGLLREFTDLEYVDLDKPYWSQSINEALTFNGKCYFATGAYHLSSYEFTHALLFNKKLLDALSLESPYGLVNDGKWTFDTFNEMAKTAVADLNGDGVMDKSDRYGLISQPKQVLASFGAGAGVMSINKDKDDKLVFTAPGDEKFMTVYQRVFEITRDDNVWYPMDRSLDAVEEIAAPFIADQGLFYNANCNRIADLRAMETNFGIIPYPKYEESQDIYYSRIENTDLPMLPVTNTDMERTGAIIEAICSASPGTVIEAYYDVTLTGKLTRDEESIEMLDLIFENRIFDYGDTLYMDDLRQGIYLDAFMADNRELTSLLASKVSVLDTKLEKLNTAE